MISHMRKQHTVGTNGNDVTLLFSWIYYHLLTVLDVVPPGFSKRRRRYSLCMNDTRVRCECVVRQHCMCKIIKISGKSFHRINIFCISLCSLFFTTNILLQCVVHAFRSPCNLNASIGKQPTVTFSTDIYTPVALEERSKLIWRPNVFMNSCQL